MVGVALSCALSCAASSLSYYITSTIVLVNHALILPAPRDGYVDQFIVDSFQFMAICTHSCKVSGDLIEIIFSPFGPYKNLCGDLQMNSSDIKCDFSGQDNTLIFA